MTADRPKLLIVAGQETDAATLSRELGERYDIVEVGKGAGGRNVVAAQAGMLLNSIGEGVALFDRTGKSVWMNRWFEAQGAEFIAHVGRVAARSFGAFERGMADIAADAGSPLQPGELRRRLVGRRCHLHNRAGRRHYEVRLWPVVQVMREGGAGRISEAPIEHVAAAVRDISSQWRMKRRIDAIDKAGRKLIHLDPASIKSLHAAERLTMLEKRVIQSARELLHFDNFAVRMVKPSTGQLELVMSVGLPEKARRVELFVGEEGNGISGHVAATGESYICPDVTKDPRYVLGIDNPGSSLTVPLRLFDKIIGIFNAESNQKDAFSDSDRQFAEIFANYIAMALHILNLLLVERWTTSQSATGTVRGELQEPLDDLRREAQLLLDRSKSDEDSSHLRRILRDVTSIRRRMKAIEGGPRSLLGVEEAIARGEMDQELAGRRVLVVDNEPEIVKIVKDVLSARGCDVVTCLTGADATRFIRLESTVSTEGALLLGSHPLDLVISDINIGDMTGYDVFAAAKEMSPDMPVILMTGFGYDPHHSIVRASQEGLQCVLFKPFQAERLVEEVKKAILGADTETSMESSAEGSRGKR